MNELKLKWKSQPWKIILFIRFSKLCLKNLYPEWQQQHEYKMERKCPLAQQRATKRNRGQEGMVRVGQVYKHGHAVDRHGALHHGNRGSWKGTPTGETSWEVHVHWGL